MKKFILTFMFFVPVLLLAQVTNDWGMPYNAEKKAFVYDEVVQVAGVSKGQLYQRTIDWIADYFKKQNKIVQKDSVQGFIKIKDRVQLFRMDKKQKVLDHVIEYHMDIFFQDGRYKYSVYKFMVFADANSQPIERWMNVTYTPVEVAKQKYANLNAEIQPTITNLKNFMQTGKVKKDETW
jgi:hypothetical protein